ncbi:MAG: DUF4177 domain-containing protein [Brooklawnia sp.]|jgi:hypothetical protein
MTNAEYYEYDFRSVRFGMFAQPSDDYVQIVREQAAKGWRLSQMIVIPKMEGGPRTLELVFERRLRGPQDRMRADTDSGRAGEQVFRQPTPGQ